MFARILDFGANERLACQLDDFFHVADFEPELLAGVFVKDKIR